MKKIITFCSLFICFLLLASCAGKDQCFSVGHDDTGIAALEKEPNTSDADVNEPAPETLFKATVGIRKDDMLILYTDQPGGLYTLNLSSVDLIDCEDSDVMAGVEIEIVYSGLTMETYPARLGDPETLHISGGKANNICEMYADMAEELWTEDPGLNGEICALEIKDDTISDIQKETIAYELGNRLGFETSVILSTREKLEKDGHINKEELYFENGALITITMDKETRTDGYFEFSAQKWASGTGAIFWFDSSASCENGVWTYEFGGFAIS